MKRIISMIAAIVLLIVLAVPTMSLAACTPKTPAIKSAAATGCNSVNISWNAVSGAKGYQIAWGKKGVSDLLDSKATVTSTNVSVSGLKENTTYAFRIRAYYKSGSSTKYTSWSSKKYVTTYSAKPSVPKIAGISSSGARVTLNWNTDSRASGFEVSWAEKGALIPWGSPVDVGKRTTYTATNRIITGATMAFRVRAYWWEGTKIKYTSWSDTKYVKISGGPDNGSTCGTTWGAWSEWSTTRKTVTANMKEEVRYHFWAAKCKNCGTHNPYWGTSTKCIHCGKTLPASNVTHVNVYTTAKGTLQKLCGRSNGRVLDGKNYWFCEAQYRYCYKK